MFGNCSVVGFKEREAGTGVGPGCTEPDLRDQTLARNRRGERGGEKECRNRGDNMFLKNGILNCWQT